jgi:sigma-B regulation protein RsbU (phosphoserine phosphatase)
LKVLIAEDDFISSQVLQNYLEKWGHEVIAAENGAVAWEHFQKNDIALVISDWMMPEMDGLELVRRIRTAERPGYVYVILLTAKSTKQDIVRGMEAGADDFLAKPFDREELRVRLRAGERIVRLEQNIAGRNEELEAANAEIVAVNRRMRRDLEMAARIQQSLLPTNLPEFPNAKFAWAFKPCEELAGDILGVVGLDERHAGLYVLDVSGHGVAAALSSVSIRHFLSPIASSTSLLRRTVHGSNAVRIVPAAEVAEELNRQFPMDAATGQYFTLLYGVLDLAERTFRYVSAGHPPPIRLTGAGAAEALDASGFPIGIVENGDYTERAVTLRPGDRLYLYSDGVPEAFNAQGSQFGTERLMKTLEENRKSTLDASLADVLSRLEDWCGSPRPVDDVSILAVELTS